MSVRRRQQSQGVEGTLRGKFAARNEALAKLGVSHWEDWYRCVQDDGELAGAGMNDDDIRCDVLLGGKHARSVAVIEFAQTPWPALPWLPSSRQDKLYTPIEQEGNGQLRTIAESAAGDDTADEASPDRS